MTGGRQEPVEAGTGRTGYGGWICTAEKGDRTTVLVFTDPRTGEDFDGALEEAERRRRVTQDPLAATQDQLTVTEDRANAAE